VNDAVRETDRQTYRQTVVVLLLVLNSDKVLRWFLLQHTLQFLFLLLFARDLRLHLTYITVTDSHQLPAQSRLSLNLVSVSSGSAVCPV